MSAVVQSDVPNAGPLQQGTPVVVVGFLVDRAAIGLGEDQIVVVPLKRGQHPLAELRGLMGVQRGDEWHRQRDRSFAALRLRRFEDQPDAGDALQGPPHRQRVVDQIDVFPLQSERFGLAQAQGESDGPWAELRRPVAAASTARASFRSRAVATSLGCCAGGSTSVATLR